MAEIRYLRSPTNEEIVEQKLEQIAVENIRRANNLHALAGKLEAWAYHLDQRERAVEEREADIAMREADVLAASIELKQWRKHKLAHERRTIKDGRRPAG